MVGNGPLGGTSPLDAGAPGERSGAPQAGRIGTLSEARDVAGEARRQGAQSRLNTPASPATTTAASSQPAKVNPNAAQPSTTKASRCSTQGDPPKPLPIPGPGRFTEPLANTQ